MIQINIRRCGISAPIMVQTVSELEITGALRDF